MSGTLFVIATPLGHLGDLTTRAAETLRAVAVVAAEDTRHTRKLLSHVDAHPDLVSVHEHVAPERLAQVVARLAAGDDVALVTDAGTPAVSDPGAALVALARAAGVPVVPLPGPSAVATALSASGLPADRYLFLGFLDRKGGARRDALATAAGSRWTVVLFEAANRLVRLLADLAEVAGADRHAVVCREMTKVHEEYRAGTLAELAAYYEGTEPRGEVTVVVSGRQAAADTADTADAVDTARRLLNAGLSKRDAVRALQETMQISRNDAYEIVTDLDA